MAKSTQKNKSQIILEQLEQTGNSEKEISIKLAELIQVLHEYEKSEEYAPGDAPGETPKVHIFDAEEVKALLWWAEAIIEINANKDSSEITKYDIKLILQLSKFLRGLQTLGWFGAQLRKFLFWLISFLGLIMAAKAGVIEWLRMQLGI